MANHKTEYFYFLLYYYSTSYEILLALRNGITLEPLPPLIFCNASQQNPLTSLPLLSVMYGWMIFKGGREVQNIAIKCICNG